MSTYNGYLLAIKKRSLAAMIEERDQLNRDIREAEDEIWDLEHPEDDGATIGALKSDEPGDAASADGRA